MRRWYLAGLLTTILAAPALAAEPVRVFAAASLTDAFGEIAGEFEKAHPESKVELNFAGTQILRTQIEQGAPADVFVSADLSHSDALKSAGLLKSHSICARNALVIVAPSGKGKVSQLEDLGKGGVKIVLAGTTVPAGRYAAQVIAKLADSGKYGTDFQARVKANVVSEETNVRMVLAKVTLGEADAGFVYLTDAAEAGGKVRTLPVADEYNVVAEYPIGILTKSANPGGAQAFVDFVSGARGQAVLRKRGFR